MKCSDPHLRAMGRCVIAPVVLLALAGCPRGITASYDVELVKDVTYGLGYVANPAEPGSYELKPLLLDVYRPEGADESRPAVLLVHGGSFNEGSKEKEEIVDLADYLAAHGYVCFAMNYRLIADNPPAPNLWPSLPIASAAHAAMVDVKAAVRFIRANAEQYGVDADRIGLLGESAGAIAAVPAAVTEPEDLATDGDEFPIPPQNHPGESTRVQAYVHLWGNADHVLTEVSRDDPPVMIVHGTEDNNLGTMFGSARRFDTVLGLVGVPNVFYEAEGFGHGAWDFRDRLRPLRALIRDFLDEYLLGEKKAEDSVPAR
jgi:dienelactone hydrolase